MQINSLFPILFQSNSEKPAVFRARRRATFGLFRPAVEANDLHEDLNGAELQFQFTKAHLRQGK